VPLPNGDFVDTDGFQMLCRGMLLYKSAHIRHVHAPYLIPTEVIQRRNTFHGHVPALLPDQVFKPLGEAG
jgi:hypothetical protein